MDLIWRSEKIIKFGAARKKLNLAIFAILLKLRQIFSAPKFFRYCT